MQRRSFRGAERPPTGRRPPTVPVLDAGLRLLSIRAHARAELRRKLSRRGYSADEIEVAVARLIELGYLDDSSFARSLVRRRGALRGPLALSAELAARGVDRAEADAAVAAFGPAAQLASATRLAERLCAQKRVTSYREMLEVVGARLVRRGFSPTIVRDACRAVLVGTPEDAEA